MNSILSVVCISFYCIRDMDTLQLERILHEHLGLAYYGVCAEDELPHVLARPLALIVNTDPSSRDGTHWTSLYIHRDGKGEFFDSYGRPPDSPVKRYLDQRAPGGWFYNTRQVQSRFSTLCGAFCVQHLESRHRNQKLPFSTLLIQLFPYLNPQQNDSVVQYRMRRHYDIRLPIFDTSFLRGI